MVDKIYYDNSDEGQRFQSGTIAEGEAVDAKFDEVATGFQGVEQDTRRALKFPFEAGMESQEFEATAFQRRNKVLGFDENGDVVLTGGFTWRGNWATSTDYVKNDVYRDPDTKNLYVVIKSHTSSSIENDESAGWVGLAISVEEVEALKEAAEVSAENASDSALAAQEAAEKTASQANLVGLWSSQIGAATPPLSVYHQGQYWQLLTPLADISSVEPGTNANVWIPMVETAIDIGQIAYSFRDLAETGLFVEPGMTYLQSEYPELFSVLGTGDAPPLSKLADPSSVPSVVRFTGVSFSPSGDYLGVAANNAGNDLFLYALGVDTPVLVDSLSAPVGGNLFCQFSPESDVLAVAGGSGNNLALYKRSGDVLSASSITVDQLPQGEVTGITFTGDGVYMACSTEDFGTQGILVYKRSGDNFSTVYQKAGANYSAIAFTHNGQYLAAARGWTIEILERTGDNFSVVDSLSLPGNCNGLHYSSDEAYLAAAHDSAPRLTVYEREGSAHTKLASPADLPGEDLEFVAFAPDARYLSATSRQPPYLFTYAFDKGSMTLLPHPSIAIPSVAYQLAFSPDSQRLAVAYAGGFPARYKRDFPFDVGTEFYVPDVENLTPQSVGDWVPGAQGKPYVRAK